MTQDAKRESDVDQDVESKLVNSIIRLLRGGAQVGDVQHLVNNAIATATFEAGHDANGILTIVASKKEPVSSKEDFIGLSAEESAAFIALPPLTYYSGQNPDGHYIIYKGTDGGIYRAYLQYSEILAIQQNGPFQWASQENALGARVMQEIVHTALLRQYEEDKQSRSDTLSAEAKKRGV